MGQVKNNTYEWQEIPSGVEDSPVTLYEHRLKEHGVLRIVHTSRPTVKDNGEYLPFHIERRVGGRKYSSISAFPLQGVIKTIGRHPAALSRYVDHVSQSNLPEVVKTGILRSLEMLTVSSPGN
jgi:hypothetical protein